MILPFTRAKGEHALPEMDLEARYTRRLSDRLIVTFHALWAGNLDAASHLLAALECEVARSVRLGREQREDGDDLAGVRAQLQPERYRHANADQSESHALPGSDQSGAETVASGPPDAA